MATHAQPVSNVRAASHTALHLKAPTWRSRRLAAFQSVQCTCCCNWHSRRPRLKLYDESSTLIARLLQINTQMIHRIASSDRGRSTFCCRQNVMGISSRIPRRRGSAHFRRFRCPLSIDSRVPRPTVKDAYDIQQNTSCRAINNVPVLSEEQNRRRPTGVAIVHLLESYRRKQHAGSCDFRSAVHTLPPDSTLSRIQLTKDLAYCRIAATRPRLLRTNWSCFNGLVVHYCCNQLR